MVALRQGDGGTGEQHSSILGALRRGTELAV